MKKRLVFITMIFLVAVTNTAYAAAPTPTSAAAAQNLNNQINQLKDKIASQVSKLNLVEKRGIVGTIQDVTNNQITLTDIHGNTRYVDVDEITKFSSDATTNFGLSDLKKGMQVSVLGIYNKESQRILARFIDTLAAPTRINGAIAAIDNTNFDLSIATDDQKTIKVEIDTTSTVTSYSDGGTLTKYGFSKLNVGDRVEVIGYPDKKDATLILTDRMIDYVSAPKDPNISLSSAALSPTPTSTNTQQKALKPIK
jgi:hypothetical protein